MNELHKLYAERDCFCDGCERWVECGGIDDAYGAPMLVREMTCPGDGDPEDLGCPEHDEYMALLNEIEEREMAMEADDDE